MNQEELMNSFVDKLPNIRKRLGITQTELGEKVGLSRQTISSIERKIVPLTWNNYLALLMFFAINSREVFYFPQKDNYEYTDALNELMLLENNKKN